MNAKFPEQFISRLFYLLYISREYNCTSITQRLRLKKEATRKYKLYEDGDFRIILNAVPNKVSCISVEYKNRRVLVLHNLPSSSSRVNFYSHDYICFSFRANKNAFDTNTELGMIDIDQFCEDNYFQYSTIYDLPPFSLLHLSSRSIEKIYYTFTDLNIPAVTTNGFLLYLYAFVEESVLEKMNEFDFSNLQYILDELYITDSTVDLEIFKNAKTVV